jgi:hypothetical protein
MLLPVEEVPPLLRRRRLKLVASVCSPILKAEELN